MSDDTQRRPQQRGGPMAGMIAGEKAKDFKGTWVKLIAYCRAYLWPIIAALVMAAVAGALTILAPGQLRKITDEIIASFSPPFALDMDAVWMLAVMLLIIYVGSNLLNFLYHWILARVTQRITKQMRTDISKKINRLPFSYFNRTSYGDVLSRMTNDVDAVGMTLYQSLPQLASAAAMFVGCIVAMFITNAVMAVTAVLTSMAGFLMMVIIIKRSQKYFVAQQKDLGVINGHVEETYTGHSTVKVYNASEEFKKDFESINGRLYNSAWKSQFLSGLMMPLMMFIGNFGYVAVCIVGAVLTMNGAITFGVVVAFTIYVRLFTQPLSQFAQAANNLQRAAAASERVFEFFEEKEMDDESKKERRLPNVSGGVEFRNVRFGYTPEKTVINDFSAKVGAGQKIAIVGPTGAGKTTIVNLLMRFYEIERGEILLDGIPINEVRREDV
ncbi:MAG: ATP-binding cassette domain-containing protein, partial [Methanomassiliicoccaceae archaeon]|nr:ATP-binding cassette domain-containing protein [Methanomassiliicoccaceae archaeon]